MGVIYFNSTRSMLRGNKRGITAKWPLQIYEHLFRCLICQVLLDLYVHIVCYGLERYSKTSSKTGTHKITCDMLMRSLNFIVPWTVGDSDLSWLGEHNCHHSFVSKSDSMLSISKSSVPIRFNCSCVIDWWLNVACLSKL